MPRSTGRTHKIPSASSAASIVQRPFNELDARGGCDPAAAPSTIISLPSKTMENAPSELNVHHQHDRWVTEVRDPANAASEGIRRIVASNNQASAEYEIAPLPDGRYALIVRLEYPGFSGSSTGWSAFPSRDVCIDRFLYVARRYFESEPTGCASAGHKQAQVEMRELLAGGLFGFEEPPIDVQRTASMAVIDRNANSMSSSK
jgi:hypothetical protein